MSHSAPGLPAGPLAGVKVLEIGQYVVVPFCAEMLAKSGARVVKVEPVDGDSYRRRDHIAPHESRHYVLKNRGKEAVGINLGEETYDVIHRLVAWADVVLINASPSAIRKHGLGYEALRTHNPNMVYASASAFGWRGTEAEYPGMDAIVQARSGLLLALGATRDGVPLHSEVQAADYATSLLLLSGVLTALFERERSGQGQEVRVSLLAGALTLQNNVVGHFYDHDAWREEFVKEVLPETLGRGLPPKEIEAARRALRADPRNTDLYRVFRTADGFAGVGAANPRGRRGFVAALAAAERENAEFTTSRVAELAADPSILDRRLDDPALREESTRIMASRPTAYWLEALREAGVGVAQVHHVDEMLFDENAELNEIIVEVDDDPEIGRYRMLGAPYWLGRTRITNARRSPRMGEHTRAVLSEVGVDAARVEELLESGLIYAGDEPGA